MEKRISILINPELMDYINKNIFPVYSNNDSAHNLDHINYVIRRSIMFATLIDDINYDMVYTVASYHDIGHYIDAKNHELVSGNILLNDENLKKFFSEKQIKTMAEAVIDHRASLDHDPRSVYGKIVSSADRNTSVDKVLERTYAYRIKHNEDSDLDYIINDSMKHIVDKFGNGGYATKKMYFEDPEYDKFLEDIQKLIANKELFRQRYIEVNNIDETQKILK